MHLVLSIDVKKQHLPRMKGSPPLEFQVDKSIKPTVISRPAVIPANWKDQVKAEIDRDVAMGVLEPVPPNTPDT